MDQQLFDKPMHELREAFVRARFAEPTMFGMPDILEWLTDPEWIGIIDFNKAPAFLKDFEAAWEDVHLGTELRFLATPHERVPDWMRDRVDGRQWIDYTTILDALRAGGAMNYYPWANDTSCFPIVEIMGLLYRVVHGANVVGLQKASVRDVFEIANAEIKGFRPNAKRARALFNRLARNAVANARKDAERDFDEAVAVSADGTKIVKAKWVIAADVERNGKQWLFPATAFLGSKIRRRNQGFRRINIEIVQDLFREGFRWPQHAADPAQAFFKDARHTLLRSQFTRNPSSQILMTVREELIRDVANVLFASIDDCPSPLPDGGQELR